MTTEELDQIRKIVRDENEPLKQGQARHEAGQKRLEQGQLSHQTALKTLGASHQDLREAVNTIHTTQKTLATKQDVDAAIEAAKSDILAVIHALIARLIRQVQSNTKRITALEAHIGAENPEKH